MGRYSNPPFCDSCYKDFRETELEDFLKLFAVLGNGSLVCQACVAALVTELRPLQAIMADAKVRK